MLLDGVQFMFGEAAILGKGDGLKPELRNFAIPLHMNVRWLAAVRAKEDKAVRANAKDSRHSL
jgi:hypothetical protein